MLTNLLKSDKYMRKGRITEMLKVSQQMSPDMTVHINQGTVIYNNQIINIEDIDTTPLIAPNIGHWLVAISIDEHGQIVYTYGIQSTDVQTFPKLPDECLHLALIDIGASDEYIINDQIYDLRTFFTFSTDGVDCCQLKCQLPDVALAESDRKLIKEYANKYEELAQELSQLKLQLQPKQAYTVLTDNGLKYEVRFKDDGTPYFEQVGIDSVFNPEDSVINSKTKNYKFDVKSFSLNIIAPNHESYIPFTLKIRSYDANNEMINAIIMINCFDARIFSENFTPQYRENEFIIDSIKLARGGFLENLAFNFHTHGDHMIRLKLYDKDTKELIDSTSVLVTIKFIDQVDGIP